VRAGHPGRWRLDSQYALAIDGHAYWQERLRIARRLDCCKSHCGSARTGAAWSLCARCLCSALPVVTRKRHALDVPRPSSLKRDSGDRGGPRKAGAAQRLLRDVQVPVYMYACSARSTGGCVAVPRITRAGGLLGCLGSSIEVGSTTGSERGQTRRLRVRVASSDGFPASLLPRNHQRQRPSHRLPKGREGGTATAAAQPQQLRGTAASQTPSGFEPARSPASPNGVGFFTSV